eukprot:Protomagalhaensia_sp_Gyna_25__1106@NODE_153_length_4806_cov_90_625131_g119_i0_p3_GENE_NODE_153_length_4806_cov_90_625131_g119_i0NODE_153_length_4806_cov_90_625131_g119_i0_p3_ORF_typecomplete_len421_score43_48Proteasom_PSMB/PF10508_9/0_022DUF3361/PF11841_8/1_4e03DUF3361/PF11841_8/0_21Adaptin_N/PF01602_20/6_6e02Adaptin_N/PF01602_20/0_42Katanin_con80/PF13925_6/1_7e03Katanin_con80/PF13925_6/1_8e02Katanin_con80/PF13925_6/8_6Arm/PF00514_23/79Arm/PF00514_23/8_1e03Arm/PF00514_23/1_1e04Arm/PF00514_23/4_2
MTPLHMNHLLNVEVNTALMPLSMFTIGQGPLQGKFVKPLIELLECTKECPSVQDDISRSLAAFVSLTGNVLDSPAVFGGIASHLVEALESSKSREAALSGLKVLTSSLTYGFGNVDVGMALVGCLQNESLPLRHLRLGMQVIAKLRQNWGDPKLSLANVTFLLQRVLQMDDSVVLVEALAILGSAQSVSAYCAKEALLKSCLSPGTTVLHRVLHLLDHPDCEVKKAALDLVNRLLLFPAHNWTHSSIASVLLPRLRDLLVVPEWWITHSLCEGITQLLSKHPEYFADVLDPGFLSDLSILLRGKSGQGASYALVGVLRLLAGYADLLQMDLLVNCDCLGALTQEAQAAWPALKDKRRSSRLVTPVVRALCAFFRAGDAGCGSKLNPYVELYLAEGGPVPDMVAGDDDDSSLRSLFEFVHQ